MKNIWTIMRKELARVFKSPTMLVTILMPGLLIYGMYSLMGLMTPETNQEIAEGETFIVYSVNMPTTLENMFAFDEETFPFEIEVRSLTTVVEAEDKRELLESEDVHLVLIFTANFEQEMLAGGLPPELRVYFNPFNNLSDISLNFLFMPVFNVYQNLVHNVLPVVPDIEVRWDQRRVSGGIVGELVPMILLALLFSVCMSIAAESIAGEKERGTIATLLATPIKRQHIAFGKIGALAFVAMLSAISSFLGLMLALPNLLAGMPVMSMYGFGELALLFLVLTATVLLIIGIMSIVSAFAKNIKEATMMLSMFMIVGMGAGLLTMIIGVPTAWFFYLIPFYNTAIAISALLSFNPVMLNLTLTVVSNLVFTLVTVTILSRLFNSEKVMFSK